MERDIQGRDHPGARGDRPGRRETFTRRIDCAPSHRPDVVPAPAPHRGHGSGGRAPGEEL